MLPEVFVIRTDGNADKRYLFELIDDQYKVTECDKEFNKIKEYEYGVWEIKSVYRNIYEYPCWFITDVLSGELDIPDLDIESII